MRSTDLIKALALPPAGLFWSAFLGLGLLASGWSGALSDGWGNTGLALVVASLVALYLLSLPLVSAWLMARLDRFPALDPKRITAQEPAALVVLDAGRRSGAGEYGVDGLRSTTLERLAYAAWLWRRLKFPIVVSGNGAGALMSTYLKELFEVPVRWIEEASHNTHENARLTSSLLRGEGIRRVVLVTHYWHLPRAVAEFSNAGLVVVAAPLGLTGGRGAREQGLSGCLPSPAAALRSHLAIHEMVGLFWYRWRYQQPADSGR